MKKITAAIKVLSIFVLLIFSLNAKSQCTPSFIYSLGPNGQVTFTSTSIVTNSLTAQYTWNFTNPTASVSATGTAGMTSSHTFTANGVYTVILTVNQPTSCPNVSVPVTLTVSNVCPLAPSANYTQGSNGLINFINNTTGTVSGATYTWNFGASSASSNSFAPSYNYTANGAYVVTLTANNNVTPACVSSSTLLVNVTSVCTFTAGINFSILPLGNVSFSATTNASSLTTNTYTWNFGVSSPSTNAQSAIVTYSANGIYTIYLTVTNGTTGCVANAVQTISITNVCAINASFTATQGMNGNFYFNNISTGTVPATSYTWNFGDGSPQSFSVSPPHTYTANGAYTVSLTASNFTPSCASTKTLLIIVNTICNLSANFTYSLGNNGLVTFSNTSTVPNPTTIVNYNWYIPPIGTFTNTNPTVTYTANGIYTVTLNDTIYSASCSSTITKTLSITNVGACGLNASFTHTLGNSGYTNFTNHSTGTLSTTSYTWDFGDGFTSTNFSPIHTYINAGTHYASLIAVNSATCVDTTFLAINVTGLTCIANSGFSLMPTSIAQYWNALPSYPWNVVNASWSWGDNTSSNTLYTSHQYSTSGNYNICLTVTVSCGATSSTCATYSVYKTANNVVNINVVKPAGVFEITGIDNFAEENRDYKIVPNPNNGWFMLALNTSPSEFKISVRNLLGQTIYEEVCVASNGLKEKQLDLRESPAGVYFVELSVGGKTHTKKIVISK